MNTSKITKQLWKGLLLTLLISAFASCLLINIFLSRTAQSLEGGQAVTIMCLVAVFCELCLTLFSATIFLNLKPAIFNNKLYSALSFFLLPALAVIEFIILVKPDDYLSVIAAILIGFFAPHIYFYIQFRGMDFGAEDGSDDIEQISK
jgi:hypothetical protein